MEVEVDSVESKKVNRDMPPKPPDRGGEQCHTNKKNFLLRQTPWCVGTIAKKGKSGFDQKETF